MKKVGENQVGHLVICGWKQEMERVVQEILLGNPLWTARDITILCKVSDLVVDEFYRVPELKEVTIIQEDYIDEAALRHAGVESAHKVMILADWSSKNESTTETDAKTVMAAMTIEKIAPSVYIVAELLDSSFGAYLKMANVDEIIHVREYSRILLSNSVSTVGLAHVFYELLDVRGKTELATFPFPSDLIGKTFKDLCDFFYARYSDNVTCIGVLENTGNLQMLKRQALSRAQKSPEMRTVLKNLSHVKEIETNLPRINPGDDYVLQENSIAIIVKTKGITSQGELKSIPGGV